MVQPAGRRVSSLAASPWPFPRGHSPLAIPPWPFPPGFKATVPVRLSAEERSRTRPEAISDDFWPGPALTETIRRGSAEREQRILRNYGFIFALIIGGGWFLSGSAGLNPDSHVQSAGWSPPTLGVGQGQGILAMIGTTVAGHSQPPDPAPAAPQTVAGRIAPNNGRANVAGPEKSGGVVPPELIRFMNPSMVTTAPNGTQSLSPAARAALRQLLVQTRANANPVKEQPGATGKATRLSP